MPLTTTATQEQITQFLDSYTASWPRDPNQPWAGHYSSSWPAATTAAELATDLLANAGFRALQLGTWLNKPDGELISSAVEAIAPPPYREDIELLTDALKLAADAQRGEGIGRALLATGAATVHTARRGQQELGDAGRDPDPCAQQAAWHNRAAQPAKLMSHYQDHGKRANIEQTSVTGRSPKIT
jgi:hypothetical protein